MNHMTVDDLRSPLKSVLFFSLMINLTLLTPSVFMLHVSDRVLSTRSIETLVMLIVIALATLFLMGVLDTYRSRILVGMGMQLEQRLGPRFLTQLLNASLRQGGRPYLDAMRDLSVLRGFLSGPGILALCDAPWAVVYVAVIFMFHVSLGWLALVCICVLLMLALANERLTASRIGDLRLATQRAQRVADSTLRNAETVTALGMAPAMTARWQEQTVAGHQIQMDITLAGGAINSTSRVLRQAVQVLMLSYGAYLVIHDNVTPGVMLAATIILGRALAPVEMMIGSWKGLVEARAAWLRVRRAMESQTDGGVGAELPKPVGRLSVEGVGYVAPGSGRTLVRGASLTAEPGQVLAIIGPSGAGKTTLARLVAGVSPPSAGVVRLGGSDLRAWDPARLGAWVGYVPQDVVLFDGTVAENIARMGHVDIEAVIQAARLAGVDELVARLPVGYDTPVGDGGRGLSAGQRQRIALARALYGDPVLVVLDEPDASLDNDGEQALLRSLRELKERGVAVVLTTQRRAALSVADTVAVMRDGQFERIAPVNANGAGAEPTPLVTGTHPR